MGYKTLHNLKLLGAILAISTFFFFSFTTSPLACFRVINVTTNLEAATFIMNGPASYSGSGTSWSVGGVPGGTYVIVFGDVKGYITPPSQSQTLVTYDNDTITFIGEYKHGHKPKSEYGYSVNIAIGDIDGDGIDEIITGAGPRPNASDEIKVIDEDGEVLSEFRADIYDQYGVNVASGDLDGDGVAEIVAGTGPGPDNEAFVKIFDVYGVEKAYFMVLDTKYGANVAVGNLGFERTDNDGDSYAVGGGDCGPQDCDDTNPDINHGKTEIPNNGIDDDWDSSTPTPTALGAGYNSPDPLYPLFRANLSLNVTAPPTGWLKYYYTRARLDLVITSITEVTIIGEVITVKGICTVKGTPDYTFTATITSRDIGTDAIGIEIRRPDRTLYHSADSQAIDRGNFSIQAE